MSELATQLFRSVLRIRRFEERLLELFGTGKLNGTTHTSIGQEATAVGVIESLAPQDLIWASHRCHGHYLARFADPVGLLAEIMGKRDGICGGRGGSQHLCRDGFYTNGIQGGYLGIATGMALAEKHAPARPIVTAFIGDGTLGEGAVYEALNLAALWQVPLLVVVENNGYAQTTPISANLAGDMAARFCAFGLPVDDITSTDVTELHQRFAPLIAAVRDTRSPRVAIVRNYRLGPHSKGDDFRPAAEIEAARARDPLLLAGAGLAPELRHSIAQEIRTELAAAEATVEAMPMADNLSNLATHALH